MSLHNIATFRIYNADRVKPTYKYYRADVSLHFVKCRHYSSWSTIWVLPAQCFRTPCVLNIIQGKRQAQKLHTRKLHSEYYSWDTIHFILRILHTRKLHSEYYCGDTIDVTLRILLHTRKVHSEYYSGDTIHVMLSTLYTRKLHSE